MPSSTFRINNLEKKIHSLSFIKATAWVILGIGSMFTVNDLSVSQSGEYWYSTIIKFGMAVLFLLAGIFFQRNQSKNIYLLMIVILVDVVVSTRPPIGLFDGLMLLFDLIYYWLIFGFLKQNKL